MNFIDLIMLSALNLYRRLARTLLTVIGVVIGTACIIIMLAIGITNLTQFEERLEDSDLNKIEIYSEGGESQLKQAKLNDAAVNAFNQIENVEMVIPMKRLDFYGKVKKYYAPYFSVIAVPHEALEYMVKLEEGTYINDNSAMPQLVMGLGSVSNFIQSEEDYSRNYEGPSLDWMSIYIDMYLGGQHVQEDSKIPKSRQYKFRVVGIIKDENTEYKSHDVYMDLDMAKQILKQNYRTANAINLDANSYENIIVYTKSMEDVEKVLKTIKEYGFEAYSNAEWITEMEKQQKAQQAQLLAIGLISLIVSAIGIANTMMTGIMERRKEIGVMKVVGVPINNIMQLFLAEAAMIGFIGGIIGVVIAHLFAYIAVTGGEEINFLGMYFQPGMKFVMPIWLDAGAVLIAMIVGVVAGYFPARNATRMSPTQAVRG